MSEPRTGATLVFVYGTFLSGERDHHILAGAEFLHPGETAPEFELIDLGSYPALVPGGATRVYGEVYAVGPALLRTLDEIEEHPSYFRRTEVRLTDGTPALSYVLGEQQAQGFPRIACGSWSRRRSSLPAWRARG